MNGCWNSVSTITSGFCSRWVGISVGLRCGYGLHFSVQTAAQRRWIRPLRKTNRRSNDSLNLRAIVIKDKRRLTWLGNQMHAAKRKMSTTGKQKCLLLQKQTSVRLGNVNWYWQSWLGISEFYLLLSMPSDCRCVNAQCQGVPYKYEFFLRKEKIQN